MRACCGGYGALATHPAQVVTSGSPGDDEWHCVPARPRRRLKLRRGAVLPLLCAGRPRVTPGRTSVVLGKGVAVRVELGGCRNIKKKQNLTSTSSAHNQKN